MGRNESHARFFLLDSLSAVSLQQVVLTHGGAAILIFLLAIDPSLTFYYNLIHTYLKIAIDFVTISVCI